VAIVLGSGLIEVLPSLASGFASSLNRDVGRAASKAGAKIPLEVDTKALGRTAGMAIGKIFNRMHPEITPKVDTDGLSRKLRSDTAKAGRDGSKGFGKAFAAGIGQVAIGSILADGIRAGAGALKGVFAGAIDEATEAMQVGKITESIIRSTGGAAKISAKGIGDYAAALSAKIGVDDEAIQAGQNLLLTFKNVKNEGTGLSAIFDRATSAGADLAAAGFGSISGNAKMLGKALNDPTKGMTALSRAGVTFTQSQQDQIKALQKSGDLLGAQKIILGEVESQVGGAAEASATGAMKMQTAWGNTLENLGGKILPILDKVQGAVATKVLPIVNSVIDKMGPALEQIGPLFERGFGVVGPIVSDVIGKAGPILQGMLANWGSLFQQLGPMIGPFLGTLMAAVQQLAPVFQQLQGTVFKAIGQIVSQLLPTVTSLVQMIVPALGSIGAAVGGVLNAVIPIVSQIVATLMSALRDNMPAIQGALTSIGSAVSGIGQLITVVWQTVGPVVLPIISALFGVIVNIIGGAFKIIDGLIKVITGVLTGDWAKAGEGLKAILGGLWQAVSGIFQGAFSILRSLFGGVVTWLLDRARGFVESVVRVFLGIVSFIRGAFSAGIGFLRGLFVGVFRFVSGIVQGHIATVRGILRGINDWLRGTFAGAFARIKGWMTGPISAAKGAIDTILGKVKGAFDSAVKGIGTIWDGLKKMAAVPVNFVIDTIYNNGLREMINMIPGVEDLPKAPTVSFDRGGVMPGYTPGRDVHKFWSPTGGGLELSGGEAIMRPEFTRAMGGAGGVEMLNKAARAGNRALIQTLLGGSQKHAGGGIVSFKGGRFTEQFAGVLQTVAKQMSFNLFQGGFRPTTSYSGTSHAGDAIDVGPVSARLVRLLRDFGIAAWDRTGMGNWAPHIHGIPLPGVGRAGGSGVWQAQDYLRGGNGLSGADNGAGSGYHPGITKGGGEFTFVGDFFEAISKLPGLLGGLKTNFDQMTSDGFGKIVKDATLAPLKQVVGWINDKIPGPGPLPGFSSGGRAVKGGWARVGEDGAEDVYLPPNSVVSPAGRRATSRLVLLEGTVSLDEEGRMMLRGLAREEIDQDTQYGRQLDRMRR